MDESTIKKTIKSLLTSTPHDCTLRQVQKDYYSLIGSRIPFRDFGYVSVEHMLKSMPDVCQVRGNGDLAIVRPVISEKSAHINEMVVRQKVTKKPRDAYVSKRPLTRPVQARPESNVPPRLQKKNDYSSNVSNPPTPYYSDTLNQKQNNGISSKPSYENTSSIKDIPKAVTCSDLEKRLQQNQCPAYKEEPKTITCSELEKRLQQSNDSFYMDLGFEKKWKYSGKESSENVYRDPGSIQNSTTDKLSTYDQQINQKLQNTHIRDSINRAVRDRADMSNECKRYLKRDRDKSQLGDYTESSSNSQSKTENKNSLLVCEPVEYESNVPKRVQENLKQLIAQYPEGIWCAELPKIYLHKFNRVLQYAEYGYLSVIQMCMSLKHIFQAIRPDDGDFKLYDVNRELPLSVGKSIVLKNYLRHCSVTYGDKESALPKAIGWEQFSGSIPHDVLPMGEIIPRQFVSEECKVDDVLDIVIAETYDPSKFWFYLSSSPLDDLMNAMQDFYRNPDIQRSYRVPEILLQVGMYCVQVIFGEYHRALVVDTMPGTRGHVKLLYIDYGTLTRSPIEGICFLHKEFALLPAQAIRGRLANIAPTYDQCPWSREAVSDFRDMVTAEHRQRAKICDINRDEQIVTMFLADVTVEDPKKYYYINEELVKRGHAVWVDQERKKLPLLPNVTCKVNQIHLYPTFPELEYGMATSNDTLAALESQKLPIQFLYPQYYKLKNEPRNNPKSLEELDNDFVYEVAVRRISCHKNKLDPNVLTDTKIDFDIFGSLKDKISLFYNNGSHSVSAASIDLLNEDEEKLFCDYEVEFSEGRVPKNTDFGNDDRQENEILVSEALEQGYTLMKSSSKQLQGCDNQNYVSGGGRHILDDLCFDDSEINKSCSKRSTKHILEELSFDSDENSSDEQRFVSLENLQPLLKPSSTEDKSSSGNSTVYLTPKVIKSSNSDTEQFSRRTSIVSKVMEQINTANKSEDKPAYQTWNPNNPFRKYLEEQKENSASEISGKEKVNSWITSQNFVSASDSESNTSKPEASKNSTSTSLGNKVLDKPLCDAILPRQASPFISGTSYDLPMPAHPVQPLQRWSNGFYPDSYFMPPMQCLPCPPIRPPPGFPAQPLVQGFVGFPIMYPPVYQNPYYPQRPMESPRSSVRLTPIRTDSNKNSFKIPQIDGVADDKQIFKIPSDVRTGTSSNWMSSLSDNDKVKSKRKIDNVGISELKTSKEKKEPVQKETKSGDKSVTDISELKTSTEKKEPIQKETKNDDKSVTDISASFQRLLELLKENNATTSENRVSIDTLVSTILNKTNLSNSKQPSNTAQDSDSSFLSKSIDKIPEFVPKLKTSNNSDKNKNKESKPSSNDMKDVKEFIPPESSKVNSFSRKNIEEVPEFVPKSSLAAKSNLEQGAAPSTFCLEKIDELPEFVPRTEMSLQEDDESNNVCDGSDSTKVRLDCEKIHDIDPISKDGKAQGYWSSVDVDSIQEFVPSNKF